MLGEQLRYCMFMFIFTLQDGSYLKLFHSIDDALLVGNFDTEFTPFLILQDASLQIINSND